jgi:hypothetical protein
VIARSQAAFRAWRKVPAPRRGRTGAPAGRGTARGQGRELGAVVTLEAGKITSEGLGEVQEMIDICDFAVGLSRQLYGLTIASERPGHVMRETWHPLGPCAVITAFNFPVAVWSWNTALALVCGNPVIWKPSEKTPLTAMACMKIDGARAGTRFRRRRAGGAGATGDRRRRGGRGAGGKPGCRHRLGHRIDADGPRGGAEGGRTLRPVRSWNWAATTR